MQPELTSRAPITALSDVETFLTDAQILKSCTVQLRERQQREAGYQRALSVQIATKTQKLSELSKQFPRLREMWKQVQRELAELSSPENGGSQP